MSGVPLAAGAATIPGAANPFLSTEFLITVGLLVLALLGGAVVLYATDVWRKRQGAGGQESAESLSSFRTLYERGELTEAEYHEIRDRLAARVKQEVAAGRPRPAAPPDKPAAPDGGSGESSAGGAAAPPGETPPGGKVS